MKKTNKERKPDLELRKKNYNFSGIDFRFYLISLFKLKTKRIFPFND